MLKNVFEYLRNRCFRKTDAVIVASILMEVPMTTVREVVKNNSIQCKKKGRHTEVNRHISEISANIIQSETYSLYEENSVQT